jgi:hypothetical protein
LVLAGAQVGFEQIPGPPFMAWAAMSISGTKSSPALKRSPTSSMALINPSFKIVSTAVPASISAWVLAFTVPRQMPVLR